MRDWSISAFFPQVRPAHLAQQSCTVRAENWTDAVQAGVQTVREREELKGKHISVVRFSIVAAGKEKTS